MNLANLIQKIWGTLAGIVKMSTYNQTKEEVMATPINIKITLEVSGQEGLGAVLQYTNTTLETAIKVENALLTALANLNTDQLKSK